MIKDKKDEDATSTSSSFLLFVYNNKNMSVEGCRYNKIHPATPHNTIINNALKR